MPNPSGIRFVRENIQSFQSELQKIVHLLDDIDKGTDVMSTQDLTELDNRLDDVAHEIGLDNLYDTIKAYLTDTYFIKTRK